MGGGATIIFTLLLMLHQRRHTEICRTVTDGGYTTLGNVGLLTHAPFD